MALNDPLDPARIKSDFPLLSKVEVGGHPLVYLDSASSSQKPRSVLDAMDDLYETTYANVHRGVYGIAAEATDRYEAARAKVARFIHAPSTNGVVFTKNVTEALNLVVYSWGRANLSAGDVVVLTEIEHHANLVPWLILREERGIELRFVPMADDYTLDLSDLDQLLDGAKLFGFTAMSNVLGTITPIRQLADAARAAGALSLVDGAQYVPHLPTDVTELGCDFFGFTGHKMLGPTGVGVLWARDELLEAMPAFLGGGEMIRDVRLDGWTPNDIPWKFEAGTPPIAEVIGLAAAVDYLDELGMAAVREHEVALTSYALRTLEARFGDELVIHGPTDPKTRGGVLSFSYRDVHPHDLSQVLDERGVCVRAGHHCAKPLMRRLRVGATARASLYVYNDESDIDALADALERGRRLLRPVEDSTMPGLEDLYREIILDHYRNPRNRGELESPPAHRVEGFNPLCGDEIVVYLDVHDGVVDDIRISGQGCSISQSSASMMSAAVKGKTVEEVHDLSRAFKGMMSIHESSLEGDEVEPEELPDVSLGDLEALRGVVKFPVRIKCATLSWNTLAQGLEEVSQPAD